MAQQESPSSHPPPLRSLTGHCPLLFLPRKKGTTWVCAAVPQPSSRMDLVTAMLCRRSTASPLKKQSQKLLLAGPGKQESLLGSWKLPIGLKWWGHCTAGIIITAVSSACSLAPVSALMLPRFSELTASIAPSTPAGWKKAGDVGVVYC